MEHELAHSILEFDLLNAGPLLVTEMGYIPLAYVVAIISIECIPVKRNLYLCGLHIIIFTHFALDEVKKNKASTERQFPD